MQDPLWCRACAVSVANLAVASPSWHHKDLARPNVGSRQAIQSADVVDRPPRVSAWRNSARNIPERVTRHDDDGARHRWGTRLVGNDGPRRDDTEDRRDADTEAHECKTTTPRQP